MQSRPETVGEFYKKMLEALGIGSHYSSIDFWFRHQW